MNRTTIQGDLDSENTQKFCRMSLFKDDRFFEERWMKWNYRSKIELEIKLRKLLMNFLYYDSF